VYAYDQLAFAIGCKYTDKVEADHVLDGCAHVVAFVSKEQQVVLYQDHPRYGDVLSATTVLLRDMSRCACVIVPSSSPLCLELEFDLLLQYNLTWLEFHRIAWLERRQSKMLLFGVPFAFQYSLQMMMA